MEFFSYKHYKDRFFDYIYLIKKLVNVVFEFPDH